MTFFDKFKRKPKSLHGTGWIGKGCKLFQNSEAVHKAIASGEATPMGMVKHEKISAAISQGLDDMLANVGGVEKNLPNIQDLIHRHVRGERGPGMNQTMDLVNAKMASMSDGRRQASVQVWNGPPGKGQIMTWLFRRPGVEHDLESEMTVGARDECPDDETLLEQISGIVDADGDKAEELILKFASPENVAATGKFTPHKKTSTRGFGADPGLN